MADKTSGLAFDKASARTFDKDGRLHVSSSHISKANVSPYMGKEIPKWDELGLDPNKVYRLYRDPVELEKAAPTFRNIQLLRKHIYVNADKPQKEDIVGSIGSDVVFNAPYLDASLCIWDAEAIALIEAEAMEELSPGYHYAAEMTPGTTPDGEAFDGRMIDIVGNHLTLVERGRTGSDVIVADALPIELAAIVGSATKPITTAPKPKENAMKQTKLGKALVAVLSAVSPKLAQDAALSGLVGGATGKNLDKKALSKTLLGMDEDLDETKVEAAIDSVADLEDQPVPKEPGAPATDESERGKIEAFLRSKGLSTEDMEAIGNMLTKMERPFGKDEDPTVKVEEEVKTAMDSMRAEFRALEAAKHAVRPVVGDVLGMDSAESVYRFALGEMKVEHMSIAADGLPAVFAAIQASKAAPVARPLAMDSAAAVDQFPGLSRIK